MMSVYDIWTSHLVDSHSTNKKMATMKQNGGLPVTLAQALFSREYETNTSVLKLRQKINFANVLKVLHFGVSFILNNT